MTVQTDLFGDPVLTRGAIFEQGDRIALVREWLASGPSACVIGHNPSDAREDRDDPTSRWWIDWFGLFGFARYTAVNLYGWVTSDPAGVYAILQDIQAGTAPDRARALKANFQAVVANARAADQVFVCWGAIARDVEWIARVCREIQADGGPDLWCWGTNADGSPKHPMARGAHRILRDQQPILWRAAA